jgi:hypothetical protein
MSTYDVKRFSIVYIVLQMMFLIDFFAASDHEKNITHEKIQRKII